MVQLGDYCRDTVSDFEGTCVARTEWLNGCWRMTLQPRGLNKDGQPFETNTFDAFQVVVVRAKSVPSGSKETGGPRPEPRQQSGPVR